MNDDSPEPPVGTPPEVAPTDASPTDAFPTDDGQAGPVIDRFCTVALALVGLTFPLYWVHIASVMGVPAHPFLVHVPVVLLPMAAVAAVAVTLVVSWRQRYLPALILVTTFALALATLSTGAGDVLRSAIRDRGPDLADHIEAGEKVPYLALAFVLLLIGSRCIDRWRAKGAGADWQVKLVGALVMLFAAANLFWVAYAGHLGSRAVWEDRPSGGFPPGQFDDRGPGEGRDYGFDPVP